jgi:circadian clock protein KaiC
MSDSTQRISTGVAGLDAILGGGLPANRLYLVQGDPGTGKTTLAMQFLIEGQKAGESGLYVALSESLTELRGVARSHDWDLQSLHMYEVLPNDEQLRADQDYTAFHPSEIELSETVQHLLDEVERVQPKRVVIDSLSEMRLLARDPLRYRRQILSLKQFLLKRECTILLLDDPASKVGEHQFQTLAHGVVALERYSPEYGRERRRLSVIKLRGVGFDGGYHDFRITRGGLEVFDRPAFNPELPAFAAEPVPSGIPELDGLLHGGPERGTSLLIMGAAGAGKSTLAFQYAVSAAARGEHATAFIFDERLHTLLARAQGLHMPLRDLMSRGLLDVHQIDPASLSPGEFVKRVRRAVEEDDAKVVIIDSLNGYLNAMPGERFLLIQMHELLTYLASRGVLTILVVAQHGLLGTGAESPVDLSYLADTVMLMRFFEHAGRVRKAVSVLKKRGGRHEDTIREIKVNGHGLRLGEPLTQFEGVLSGTPVYTGPATPLLAPSAGEPS